MPGTNQNYTSYNTSYGFAPVQRPVDPMRAQLRRTGSAIGFALLLHQLLIAAYRFASLLFNMALALLPFGSAALENLRTGCDMLAYLLAYALPLLVCRALVGIPFTVAFPMRRVRASTALASLPISLGTMVVAIFASIGVSYLLQLVGLSATAPDYPVPHDVVGMLLYLLNLVVLPPLVEEFFFRGVLMQSLRRFGDGFALLASALLFGLMHTYPDQIAYAFLMGLVIGFFVLRTGSLRIGILLHACNNAFTVLLSVLYEFLPDGPVDIALHIIYILYIILAFISVVYFLRRDPQFFRLEEPEQGRPCRYCMQMLFTAFPMIAALALFAWEVVNALL